MPDRPKMMKTPGEYGTIYSMHLFWHFRKFLVSCFAKFCREFLKNLPFIFAKFKIILFKFRVSRNLKKLFRSTVNSSGNVLSPPVKLVGRLVYSVAEPEPVEPKLFYAA